MLNLLVLAVVVVLVVAFASTPSAWLLGVLTLLALLLGVHLVVGANDTVNPAAGEDPGSPFAGMPVLRVWEAGNVVVFKRSMAAGYAGIQNPLFFRENSRMLFGDARDRVEEILAAVKGAEDAAVFVASTPGARS